MRNIIATFAVAGLVAASATTAFAGQPVNPGAFGTDRAASIETNYLDNTVSPGASDWGKLAGERGATNGDENRNWKEIYGGAPTQGSGEGSTNERGGHK